MEYETIIQKLCSIRDELSVILSFCNDVTIFRLRCLSKLFCQTIDSINCKLITKYNYNDIINCNMNKFYFTNIKITYDDDIDVKLNNISNRIEKLHLLFLDRSFQLVNYVLDISHLKHLKKL